jgi:hypothetical protein
MSRLLCAIERLFIAFVNQPSSGALPAILSGDMLAKLIFWRPNADHRHAYAD